MYQTPYLFGTPRPTYSQKRPIHFDYGNGVVKTTVYGTIRQFKQGGLAS